MYNSPTVIHVMMQIIKGKESVACELVLVLLLSIKLAHMLDKYIYVPKKLRMNFYSDN